MKLIRRPGGRFRVINAAPRKMIGEILISLGYVSLENVNEARLHQMQRTGKKIGECLVDMGILGKNDIDRALLAQVID